MIVSWAGGWGPEWKTQLNELKSQINHHFLFNSFNTLITIIEDNQDKAVDYVETLSDYFRSMLNYRDKDVIQLSEELEIVSAYFYLQQKRFGEYLSLNINVSSHFKEGFSVPPLSIQLLVENAIKHNAVSHETPLQIDISIDDKNQLLTISNNLNPKKTLFVDDKKENTDIAEQLGLQVWNLQVGKEDVIELFDKKKDDTTPVVATSVANADGCSCKSADGSTPLINQTHMYILFGAVFVSIALIALIKSNK